MQALRFNGEVRVKRESSPCGSDLELGLGINGGCGTLIKEEQGQVLFTGAQIQELYLQETVFRFLLSGLPVPIHFVFPIWSSVVSSSEIEIHRHFPSLAMLFGLGYPSTMNDSEPGRCRRTDGKKWRCYQPAIPHQKYCEKHLHRGANRSRKHVEASKYALKPFVPAVSTSLDLMAPCSHSEKRARGMLEDGSSSHNGNGDWKSKGKSSGGDRNGAKKSTKVRTLVGKCSPKDETDYSIDKSISNLNPSNISDANVSNLGNSGSSDASFSPGFGVLRKSVLQHDKATVSTHLNLDCKAPEENETESQRCKRTDGRRWRCGQDVVPDKTLCEMHLHRGEKRATLDSNMVIGTHVSIPKKGKPSKVENKIYLNTDLSIQMAATPEKTAKGGNSISIDATSVSDESATTIST